MPTLSNVHTGNTLHYAYRGNGLEALVAHDPAFLAPPFSAFPLWSPC